MTLLGFEQTARYVTSKAGETWRDASFSRKFVACVAGALLLAQAPLAAYEIYSSRQEVEAEAQRRAVTALEMFAGSVSQSMLHRTGFGDDDPSINAFNGQMEYFSKVNSGVELWAAMSKKVLAYQRENGRSEIEPPRDRFDQIALTQAAPVSGFDGESRFRMTRPLNLGEGPASHKRCFACHQVQMGVEAGEPIGALSVAIDLSESLAHWRAASWRQAGGAVLLVLFMTPLIYALLSVSALKPLQRLVRSTRAIAQGNLEADIPDRNRRDEIGDMAAALEVFRANAVSVRELMSERERAVAAEERRNEEREQLHCELHSVLRGVLAGDYSERVNGAYENSELNTIVLKINELIAGAGDGRRTIADQAKQLKAQVVRLEELLKTNGALRDELRRASEAIAGMNESLLQRLGADLHDGPAQILAYATLRLCKLRPALEKVEGEVGVEKLEQVNVAVKAALREVRTISTGLSVPQLASANLVEAVRIAVNFHREQTGSEVEFVVEGDVESVPEAMKLCCYRITQEALSNGFRHGGGNGQRVTLRRVDDEALEIIVSDSGPGFDAQAATGGLGLAGMRARTEALSGTFEVRSRPGRGATIRATFDLK